MLGIANVWIWSLVAVFVVLLWAALSLKNKAPEASTVNQFINLLNARGGNILILVVLSAWFFSEAMKLFYYALSRVDAGTLKPENTILLMGLAFVTGTAFGGAFGALLKTMTGDTTMGRSADRAPSNSSLSPSPQPVPPAVPGAGVGPAVPSDPTPRPTPGSGLSGSGGL